MDVLLLVLVSLLALPLTVFVQLRLPAYTSTLLQAYFTRLLLLVTGLGLGYVAFWRYDLMGGSAPWLAFIAAFALAHVPAGVILLIKRDRGEFEP